VTHVKITDRWLARQLRPYDVRSRSIRIGNMTANGYLESDLDEVFNRYVTPPAAEAVGKGRRGRVATRPG
jgi:hypothetical protein